MGFHTFDASLSCLTSFPVLSQPQAINSYKKFSLLEVNEKRLKIRMEAVKWIWFCVKIIIFFYFPIGLIVAGTVFLLAQLAVIAIWTYLYQRRRKLQPYSTEGISNTSSYGSHSGSSGSTVLGGGGGGGGGGNVTNTRSESLCKLYEGGFGQRHGRQFWNHAQNIKQWWIYQRKA